MGKMLVYVIHTLNCDLIPNAMKFVHACVLALGSLDTILSTKTIPLARHTPGRMQTWPQWRPSDEILTTDYRHSLCSFRCNPYNYFNWEIINAFSADEIFTTDGKPPLCPKPAIFGQYSSQFHIMKSSQQMANCNYVQGPKFLGDTHRNFNYWNPHNRWQTVTMSRARNFWAILIETWFLLNLNTSFDCWCTWVIFYQLLIFTKTFVIALFFLNYGINIWLKCTFLPWSYIDTQNLDKRISNLKIHIT